MNKTKIIKLKAWHVYWVAIPYWNHNSLSYIFKYRPAVFYKDAAENATFLPITSNEDNFNPGKPKKNPNLFEVAIKLEKHSLICINQPICVSKQAINFNKKPIMIQTKIRRSIIRAWSKLMIWPYK